MPQARKALLPFAALSGSYFAHIGFFNPYLSLWLKDLGFGLVLISLMTALQAFSRVFAPLLWGWISDHTGERVRLLRLGAAVALASACLLALELSPLWLAVVLLVMFCHTSAMMPMSEAAMAHLVSRGGSFDAGLYGRVRLWGSIGFLITVLAAGAAFERWGMRLFPLVTVLSLLAVCLSVWRLPDLKEAQHAQQGALPIAPILAQRQVRWFFASAFFHVLSHIGIYVFFSLYLDSLGYPKTLIGGLWAVSVVVEILWFFFQARWLPRLPLTGWLLACALAMVARMLLTAAWGDVLLALVLAQALHALTFAAHHTACTALLSEYFPGRLRGRGQALYTVIGYGIPGVIGAVCGGWLSEQLGLASVYWLSLLISLLASLTAWQVWRLRPLRSPRSTLA
jgi:PPP family 3-phenylpropionic acid transporter